MLNETKKTEKQMEKFNYFKKHLGIITTINVGDKLGKYNNTYYIDGAGITQKARRWWYSQDRKKTFNNLNKDFVEFTDYLDNILSETYNNKKIIDDIVLFINDLMVGLYNLKTTYPDYKNIKCKIDSIIMIFIDFKEAIDKKPINKVTYRRNSFE